MEKNIKAITLGTLHKELFFNKKVSISFDTITNTSDVDLNVLVQIEPPSIINTTQAIIKNQNKFDIIFAWNNDILNKCGNSVLFPFGSCWIKDEDQKVHEKTKEISIIASVKRQTMGHNLRHNIIQSNLINLDLFGNGYNPIENKITALKDYRFSLIIENEKMDNWFTEKIIDCLTTGTIPVYWGCPNIGNYFDTRGFIIVDSIEELISKKNMLNETTYSEMLPYIKINFGLAKKYTDFWSRVEEEINKKLNA
jgi:hypothetical protein